MLNLRLYRTAWLVAGVAIVVALLTLQPAGLPEEPRIPVVSDGRATLEVNDRLEAVAPERAPGTEGGRRATEWIEQELRSVPGARDRVQRQEFVARADGQLVSLANVYLSVPGEGRGEGGILVVAPRDSPVGVAAGASGTALLVRQARLWAASTHRRPLLFVSTDGSTIGNAGIRWFLSRFSDFPIDGAVVLDAPGEGSPGAAQVWSHGRSPASALGLAAWAGESLERAGIESRTYPSFWRQLGALAVPQTFGDQGPLVSAGVPAVTISGRSDSPLRSAEGADEGTLDALGAGITDLIASIDGSRQVPTPARELELGGKLIGPTLLRTLLLILAVPVLVAGGDVLNRMRRAGVPLAPGVRGLARRVVPVAAVAVLAYALALLGLFPGSAAGAPPLPGDAPFGAQSGLAIGLCIAVAAVAIVGSGPLRASAHPASEAGVAAVALAALLLVTWIIEPFALLLMLPAAHAALLATVVTRSWQVLGLGLFALVAPLALTVGIADQLDRNPAFAAWYLVATTADGARGALGPLIATVAIGSVSALAALALLRARKATVAAHARVAGRGARARRRARR